MKELEQIPEDCRAGYARLISELVKSFTLDKVSGESIVRMKAGVPVEVEPHPRIRLDR